MAQRMSAMLHLPANPRQRNIMLLQRWEHLLQNGLLQVIISRFHVFLKYAKSFNQTTCCQVFAFFHRKFFFFFQLFCVVFFFIIMPRMKIFHSSFKFLFDAKPKFIRTALIIFLIFLHFSSSSSQSSSRMRNMMWKICSALKNMNVSWKKDGKHQAKFYNKWTERTSVSWNMNF